MRFAFVCCLVLFGCVTDLAQATCRGADIRDQLTPAETARIAELSDGIPNPDHRLWSVTMGAHQSILVGTIHIDSPDLALPMGLEDQIATADQVLVEITEADQKIFESRLKDPSVLFDFTGPGLMTEFSPETWRLIADALSDAGLPRITHNTLAPWFANLLLALPPCGVKGLDGPSGLDPLITQIAGKNGVPTQSLDDPDALLTLFMSTPRDQTIDFIRMTVPMLDDRNSLAVAMTGLYRDGAIYDIWSLNRVYVERFMSPERTAALFDALWAQTVDTRNLQWIDRIDAAARTGNTVIGVGALHLPGENGIVQLLKSRGFTVTPIPENP